MGYSLDPSLWALAISASLFAGVWTFVAYRRRGLAAGIRGVAWMLLPFAALFTGTLTLVLRVVDATTAWATGLVFSPLMWAGLALLGVSIVLLGVARVLDRRSPRRASDRSPSTPTATSAARDPEMDEIEAILRDRGIT